MSTAFHPQTDGATERMIRSVGQIFQSAISADQTDWVDKAPMVEFAINSSVSETTGMAPFEINSTTFPTIMPRIQWGGSVHKGIWEFIETVEQNLNDAYDAIIAARVFQKVKVDKHRKAEPELQAGSKVYLATKDLALPRGRAGKFLPKFIGPYLVLEAKTNSSNYRLDLPEDLQRRRIHPVFHISHLCPHNPNDKKLFPGRGSVEPYDFREPDEETRVNSIDGHCWNGAKLQLHIKWIDGTDSWESLRTVNECAALDDYLVLHGVGQPDELPKPKRRGGWR